MIQYGLIIVKFIPGTQVSLVSTCRMERRIRFVFLSLVLLYGSDLLLLVLKDETLIIRFVHRLSSTTSKVEKSHCEIIAEPVSQTICGHSLVLLPTSWKDRYRLGLFVATLNRNQNLLRFLYPR